MGKNVFDVALGKIISERREAMRMTQDELGSHFGLSRQTICGYEKGYRSMNANLFFEMCEFLRLKPNEVAEEVKKIVKK